jgi:UDP-N-acetylmuramoylalanine-D-glutamate ligase
VAAFLASAVSPEEQEWLKLQACISDLVGLPHRMELIHRDEHGINWINDSKATNVDSLQVCEFQWFSMNWKDGKKQSNSPLARAPWYCLSL